MKLTGIYVVKFFLLLFDCLKLMFKIRAWQLHSQFVWISTIFSTSFLHPRKCGFDLPWFMQHTSISPDRKLMTVVGDHLDGLLVDPQNGKVLGFSWSYIYWKFSFEYILFVFDLVHAFANGSNMSSEREISKTFIEHICYDMVIWVFIVKYLQGRWRYECNEITL